MSFFDGPALNLSWINLYTCICFDICNMCMYIMFNPQINVYWWFSYVDKTSYIEKLNEIYIWYGSRYTFCL